MCTLLRVRCASGVVCWAFFDRVGPGTIGWEKQQLDAGMGGQPLLRCFGFMDIAMIHDDIQTPILWGRIARLNEGEQLPEQRIRFPSAQAVPQRPRGHIKRSRQIILGVLPGRHHRDLGAFLHPRRPDFR